MVDFIDFDGDARLRRLTEKFLAGLHEGGFVEVTGAVAGATVAQILTNPADIPYFTETKLRKHHRWTVLQVLVREGIIRPDTPVQQQDLFEHTNDPTLRWLVVADAVSEATYLHRKSQRTTKSVNGIPLDPVYYQATDDLVGILENVGATTDARRKARLSQLAPLFDALQNGYNLDGYIDWAGEPHGLFRVHTPRNADTTDGYGGKAVSLTHRGRQAAAYMRRRRLRGVNQPPNATGDANARVCVG